MSIYSASAKSPVSTSSEHPERRSSSSFSSMVVVPSQKGEIPIGLRLRGIYKFHFKGTQKGLIQSLGIELLTEVSVLT